ncbi:MAG: isopeptide-forming domain-containing fimbrial protein [Chloroflexota bacterium]
MVETTSRTNRQLLILGSLAFAALFILVVTQVLIAAEAEILPPDLSESTKTVNREEANAGSTLQYEINVRNTGNQFAIAHVTDTLVPELTYVPGSLVVQNGGSSWGEAGNVITWSGAINAGSEVVISFQAMLDEELAPETLVTNTAEIYLDGEEAPAAMPNVFTTIVEQVIPDRTTAYLPIMFRPLPIVTLNPIARTAVDNNWTLSWNLPDPGITRFEVQESQNPSFINATTVDVGLALSRNFAHERSFNNEYYYRVRGFSGSQVGPWSNVEFVAGNYRDDYQNDQSGWGTQRRTSAESGEIEVRYRADDVLEVSVLDDNEFVIFSPLRRAPELPVKFEMEAEINGAQGSDVEQGFIFSLIFGADWDGGSCAHPDNNGCFTNYYRLRFRWTDSNPDMQFRLDWVEGHGSDGRPNNTKLIDWTDIDKDVDIDDWIEVDALVEADGDIKIFMFDDRIGTYRHSRIVNEGFEPYFGLGASTEAEKNNRVKYRFYEAEKAIENSALFLVND